MKNQLNRRFIAWITIFAMIMSISLQFDYSIAKEGNTAPVWRESPMPAIKSEDNVVVSKGNPFTPSQFITSKWEDP